MKVFYSFVVFCFMCLCSCKQNTSGANEKNADSLTKMKMVTESNGIISSVDSAADVIKKPDWVGTYQRLGKDEVVETTIILREDSTYIYTAKYHGTAPKEVGRGGKFEFSKSGDIVILKFNDMKGEPSEYTVSKNVLTRNGSDPKSSTVYYLTKEK